MGFTVFSISRKKIVVDRDISQYEVADTRKVPIIKQKRPVSEINRVQNSTFSLLPFQSQKYDGFLQDISFIL